MNPKPLIFVDLDDTLFQTNRKSPPTPLHKIATLDQFGEPLSYMLPKQQIFVNWLLASADVIPVTARSVAGFRSGSQDLPAWSAHKRSVNAAKQWIRVNLSQVSMLRYPNQVDFVVVTFEQQYRSSNLSNVVRKRQYWQKELGRWRIVYEGTA